MTLPGRSAKAKQLCQNTRMERLHWTSKHCSLLQMRLKWMSRALLITNRPTSGKRLSQKILSLTSPTTTCTVTCANHSGDRGVGFVKTTDFDFTKLSDYNQ